MFTKSPFVVNFVHSCPKAFDLFVIGQPQLMTIDYILTEICQKLQGFRSLQVSHVNRQGKISQIYPYYYTKASKANNNKTSFFQTKQKVKVHVSYPFTLQTKQIKINYYFLSYFSYIHWEREEVKPPWVLNTLTKINFLLCSFIYLFIFFLSLSFLCFPVLFPSLPQP